MIAAPVRSDGQVIGLVEVFSPVAHAFTNSDQEVLQRLAEIVANTIRRSVSTGDSTTAISAWGGSDNATKELSDEDESGGLSRRTRLLLALGAAAVATLLALVVIPQVRSKISDSRPAAQTPDSKLAANHASIPQESLDALRNLADNGDATAQFALGIRYATGDQVKQDYTQAARWFMLAADRGEVKAQSVLVAYYWDGTGVPKDMGKAYFWAVLARANGDQASKVRAAELASRISSSDRSAMEEQADNWLTEHGSNSLSSASK